MKIMVKNNKSVIVPAKTEVDTELSVLKQNSGSNETPETVVQMPYMLGVAAMESKAFDEHAKEVQKELLAVAEDAAPIEKEVKAIDVIAAGKERDYDYSHPIVKNMYTGKLILDESFNASLTETIELERPEGATDADYTTREVEIDTNAQGKHPRQLSIEKLLPVVNYTNGGIYPQDVSGNVNDIDDLEWTSITLDDIKAQESDRQAKINNALDLFKENCIKKAIAEVSAQQQRDYDNAHAIARKEAIEQIDKEGKYKLPDKSDATYNGAKRDRDYAINALEHKLFKQPNSFEYYDKLKVARADELYNAGKDKIEKKGNRARRAFFKLPEIILSTDTSDTFGGWAHYRIDGSVINNSAKPRTITNGKYSWLERNKWALAYYNVGDTLTEPGKKLGLDFAKNVLDYLKFKEDSYVPTENSSDKDLLEHTFIYSISGDVMDIYSGFGQLNVVSTAEDFSNIAKNIGTVSVARVIKNKSANPEDSLSLSKGKYTVSDETKSLNPTKRYHRNANESLEKGHKMSFSELTDTFAAYNKEHNIIDQLDKNALKGVIVFTEDSFTKPYTELERSYVVNGANKYFLPNMNGNSIYGNCLDGKDRNLRLDWKMFADSDSRWNVEYCYILDDANEGLIGDITSKIGNAVSNIGNKLSI